jgi:hypothetical protein
MTISFEKIFLLNNQKNHENHTNIVYFFEVIELIIRFKVFYSSSKREFTILDNFCEKLKIV